MPRDPRNNRELALQDLQGRATSYMKQVWPSISGILITVTEADLKATSTTIYCGEEQVDTIINSSMEGFFMLLKQSPGMQMEVGEATAYLLKAVVDASIKVLGGEIDQSAGSEVAKIIEKMKGTPQ